MARIRAPEAMLLRLARLSLSSSVALLLTACLDEPPSYDPPRKVGPLLIVSQADPASSVISTLEVGTTYTFSVPFRSVDDGEELEANLYVDREPGGTGIWRYTINVPPSSAGFDAIRPPVTVAYSPTNLQPGCHSLTLILAHASLWGWGQDGEGTGLFRQPTNESLAASIIWWVTIPGEPDEELRECPQLGEPSP